MKIKGTQKPSLIILGRTTLALMLLTIAAVSFGAGYLTGYQFTSTANDDRPVISASARPVLPPDEKRVLEPTPPPVSVQPPGTQAQSQQQPVPEPQKPREQPLISVKPSAPEASTPPAKAEQQVAMAEKPAPAKPQGEAKPEEPKKAPAKQQAPETPPSEHQKPADLKKKSQPTAAPQAAPVKSAEAPTKAVKKKAAAKTHAPKKGGYAVQFGAFAEAPKAEQLKKALIAKGIKAYILPKDKKSSYARVRAGSFAQREEAVHYAEVCRTKGFEGFVTK